MSENLTQDPAPTDGGHDDVVAADHTAAGPESDGTADVDSPDSQDGEPGTATSGATELADTEPADAVDADTEDADTELPDAVDADTELPDAVDADTEDADADGGHPEQDGSRPAPTSRRGQLEREGEVAADFLETLLDICDLDGDIDVDIDGDRAAVSIVDSEDGRVPRRLIGQGGQVLDALQELTRLAVQSATGERSRLMLDVGGHRAERRATLVTLAKEAIDEVRSTGERKPLTPMTAFERKVVHDEVLAAGLVSESEGSEPRRYVVIIPA